MLDLSPENLSAQSDATILSWFENTCRREGASRVGTEESFEAYKELRILRDVLLTRLEYYSSLNM